MSRSMSEPRPSNNSFPIAVVVLDGNSLETIDKFDAQMIANEFGRLNAEFYRVLVSLSSTSIYWIRFWMMLSLQAKSKGISMD